MLNLDPAKLLVIAVVAIILLGPDRLPQLARQVGAAWRSFNEFRHRMETEVRSTMPDLPSSAEIARLARSPSALLNHLSNMSDSPPSTNGDAEAAVDGDESADGSAAERAGTAEGTEAATAAPAADAPAYQAPPAPQAEPATGDEAPNGSAAAVTPVPRLVPPDPGVVAPGDPTLN